jgi:hypothetical protein
MKNVIRTVMFVAVVAMLTGCGLEEESSQETVTTPVTFNYAPLRFKVKVGYTATFTYTPRDRSDAADYVIAEFERKLEADGNGGYGYEIAEGQQPDLYVTITVNSDDSNNKSMHVVINGANSNVPMGTSTDGKTCPYTWTFDTSATYRDPDKMIDDMADKVDGYASRGWWQTVNE